MKASITIGGEQEIGLVEEKRKERRYRLHDKRQGQYVTLIW